jgi:hypothetical protein
MSEPGVIEVPHSLSEAVARLEEQLEVDLPAWDRRHHGVERLLAEWSVVAEGRRAWGDVEEYLHELGARDLLFEAMSAATGALRVWLVRRVDEIDEIYHASTDLDTDDLMWVGAVDDPLRWWRRRLPRDEDLRREIVSLAPSMREQRRGTGSVT